MFGRFYGFKDLQESHDLNLFLLTPFLMPWAWAVWRLI